MIKQEKLTKIEAVIREVCPELQELSFGCHVVVAGIAKDNPGCENDVVVHGRPVDWDNNMVPTEYYGRVPRIKIEKIIGHPIHLEHILRAINKKGYKNGFMNDIFHSIGSNGQIVMISVGDIFEELCVFDLTKPLHLQSDEFISWLYEVLCG